MNTLLFKEDPIDHFLQFGGGKATHLARLGQMQINVPPWFCLTTNAFDQFIQTHSLQEKLKPTGNLKEFSQGIEELFLSLPLPETVEAAIRQGMLETGLEDTFVAVRSSGMDEDSPGFSFAGQYSSFLYQKGEASIVESIKKAWSSGFSERSLVYRSRHGLPCDSIQVGVIIQKMVNADIAGVAFSRNPISPLKGDTIIIDSLFGQGAGLVDGLFDADHFVVNRNSLKISSTIALKGEKLIQKSQGGLEKVGVEPRWQKEPSLTQEQIEEIARLVLHLEKELRKPQDCEWAFEKGSLFCLQTRPITTVPPLSFYDKDINDDHATLWDNSNIIESYSGVTSPLTFSFASRAYQKVYTQFFEVMGVPEEMVQRNENALRNMLGLVRGRMYYNLINWYELVSLLPGSQNNKEFMETMMGVKDSLKPSLQSLFDIEVPQYSLWDKTRLFTKTLWRIKNISPIVKTFKKEFNDIYQKAWSTDFSKLTFNEQVSLYYELEETLLEKWKAPIINDFLCMVFFGLLKKWVKEWVMDKGSESIQNDLLCGQGDIESTEPTKMLMGIAEAVDHGDEEFRQWFLETAPEKIWEKLQNDAHPHVIFLQLQNFLDRYGFRCVNELKLEEKDLYDDPSFALYAVTNYIRSGAYSIEEMEERETLIRQKAMSVVNKKLKGPKRWAFHWILKQARTAIAHRESMRFDRTKIFGVLRHLFRAMGDNLVAFQILENRDDIFYLKLDEILAYAEGRSIATSFDELVSSRKREFNSYRIGPPPPDRFLTYGAPTLSMAYPYLLADGDLLKETGESTHPNQLQGTPCCPGIVEGEVLVAKSAADASLIDGQILATERTDPGWIPLYPSCAALLIERGSLLSHSAVVARELGLPTIIGIKGGMMQKLKTGQKIRVDAGQGLVILKTN